MNLSTLRRRKEIREEKKVSGICVWTGCEKKSVKGITICKSHKDYLKSYERISHKYGKIKYKKIIKHKCQKYGCPKFTINYKYCEGCKPINNLSDFQRIKINQEHINHEKYIKSIT